MGLSKRFCLDEFSFGGLIISGADVGVFEEKGFTFISL
jgi:hypothetical protein